MARNATLPVTQPQVAEDAVHRAHAGGPEMIVADKVGDTPMTIGEVARQFGMTLRALRFYEARRLITPQRHGAMRLYHRRDRERLTLILTGRRLGFTLTEIGDILDSPDGKGLHLTREQCVAQINLLEQQKHGIEIAIAELRRICTSFYKKLLEDMDSRRGMAGKN
jgi:DNA-binding transcriptional MerR regulator